MNVANILARMDRLYAEAKARLATNPEYIEATRKGREGSILDANRAALMVELEIDNPFNTKESK